MQGSGFRETSVGGIRVLPHEHLVFVEGRPVELTTREFDILLQLASHPGWVYSPEQLADGDVEVPEFSTESVSVHVSHLRRKLAEAGATGVLETVRGVGYRLHSEAGDASGGGTPPAEIAGSLPPHGPRVDWDRTFAQPLKDSLWDLTDAVLHVEHSGTAEQVAEARRMLDEVRQALARLLDQ